MPVSKKKEPRKREVTVTNKDTTYTKSVVNESTGTVYMEKGFTKDMGAYNSARVTVGITLPIHATSQDIKAAKKTIVILDELIEDELDSQYDLLK